MTEQMNVPKLRFDEFDGEWQKLTLKQVSTKNISYGVVQTGDKDLIVPCVRVVDLTSGSLNRDTFIKTSEAINQSYKKTILESGELMVALRGVIGLTRAVPVDLVGCNLTRGIARISPDQKRFSSQFIEQALNTPKSSQRFDQLKNGSALKEISIGELNKYSTDYPYLPEQQKIASFLSKVDEKISLLTEKKDKLTEYKKGVMQRLFNGKWQEQNGQLTFIPPTLRFKANDGSDFPDWEEIELGKLSKKSTDKNKDTSVSAVLTNSATQGIIPQADYFDRDIANQSNLDGYYVVKPNDFVYNPRISTPAPVGPINRNKLDVGVMSPLYTVFTVNKSVSLSYLEYFFKTTNWHRYMNSIANFGARHDRMNITTSDFFKMPIPVPCIEEQNKIVQFVSSIEQKLDLANSELEKAKEWKKGLLQQMFV